MKVSHNISDPVSMRPVLTIKEAAELYHVETAQIRKWIKFRPDYDWNFKNGTQVLIWNEKFKLWFAQFKCTQEIA